MADAEYAITLGELESAIRADRHHANILRSTVTYVLGSDRAIGRNTTDRSTERRVAVTPRRLADMIVALKHAAGVDVQALVVRGAGTRAGHSDHDYLHALDGRLDAGGLAGVEIVDLDELPFLETPPDVVEGLKEPSPYELVIPGPFCRVGALHTGELGEAGIEPARAAYATWRATQGDDGSGAPGSLRGEIEGALAVSSEHARYLLMIDRRATVLDGSLIGVPERYFAPVRASMSRRAGEVAALWIIGRAGPEIGTRKVVIIGGGAAGIAAAERLDAEPGPTPPIVIVDLDGQQQPVADRIRAAGLDHLDIRFVANPVGLDGEPLRNELDDTVAGVVLAVARPGREAPKVVSAAMLLERLPASATIVDISIDEGGAIADLADVRARFDGIEAPLYRVQKNMPRALPAPSSDDHADAVIPYVTALLYLAAKAGTHDALCRALRAAPSPGDPAGLDALGRAHLHLHLGAAFYADTGELGPHVIGRDHVARVVAPPTPA